MSEKPYLSDIALLQPEPRPGVPELPLSEAMQQSQHRSVQQAVTYYNDGQRPLGRAARLY